MQDYVVGFCFTMDADSVVLIKKNRPKWQAGLWNGVGGHVEIGETHEQAMIREFQEETGLEVNVWELTAIFGDGETYRVFIYATRDWNARAAVSKTDEEVAIHDVKTLILENIDGSTAIFNMSWHLLLARQKLLGRDKYPYYKIEY